MTQLIDIKELNIKQLVSGTQESVHKNYQIHFRVNEYLRELIRQCIEERGLSGETEFFTKLALDYFGRIGWMEHKTITPKFCTDEDLKINKPKFKKLTGSQNGVRAYLKIFGNEAQRRTIERQNSPKP